jgi:nucleotide-binding universal stress UspA family protein
MYRKILVPTDGSEHALKAAGYAVELARLKPDTRITLIYVHTPYEGLAEVEAPFAAFREAMEKHGEDMMARTAAVFEKAGIKVDKVFRWGDPGSEIAQLANNEGFDLVVMGTRGAGALGTLLMGSVARKVVHLAQCPVFLVK